MLTGGYLMVNLGCQLDWISSQLKGISECVPKCFREGLTEEEDPQIPPKRATSPINGSLQRV